MFGSLNTAACTTACASALAMTGNHTVSSSALRESLGIYLRIRALPS